MSFKPAALEVRLLAGCGGAPHVDGMTWYGFTKLPPDELERRYTVYRFAPDAPDGYVNEYDGKGGWRHVEAPA